MFLISNQKRRLNAAAPIASQPKKAGGWQAGQNTPKEEKAHRRQKAKKEKKNFKKIRTKFNDSLFTMVASREPSRRGGDAGSGKHFVFNIIKTQTHIHRDAVALHVGTEVLSK